MNTVTATTTAADVVNQHGEMPCEVTDSHEAATAVSGVSPVISPAVSLAASNVENNQNRDVTHQSSNQSGSKSGSTEKPNCYLCKHRRELLGDCHSSCGHPAAHPIALILFATGKTEFNTEHIHIRGNTHGVRSGWFNWPLNFDPTWLEVCTGYAQKDES